MKHELEFSKPAPVTPAQDSRELACAYHRLFASDDGKRVLADLRRKFGLQRLVFVARADGRFDTIQAAITDGQRQVIAEIEGAILHGAPGGEISTTQQPKTTDK